MSGTIGKLISSARPNQREKAQVAIDGADRVERDLRIENSLTDEHGDEVKLKKGAHVEVTVTGKEIELRQRTLLMLVRAPTIIAVAAMKWSAVVSKCHLLLHLNELRSNIVLPLWTAAPAVACGSNSIAARLSRPRLRLS
jgi:hypothetical protein